MVLCTATLLAGGGFTSSRAGADPTSTPVRYSGGPYVALGDSRASGSFFTPTPGYFEGCKRSALNYPTVVAALTLPRRFIDASCAGAQSAHLYRAPQHTSGGTKPIQLHLVPRDAQLITVSIGGNDMKWGGIYALCTTAPLQDRRCRYSRHAEREVRARIARMDNRVTPALAADFPDLRFVVFWAMHILVVWAAVFLTFGLGHRPDWSGYRRTVALTATWMLVLYPLNLLLGTNYGFVNGKPGTGSLLDLLGPWPVYLAVEVVIVALVWALMTWPWTRQHR